MLLALSAGQKIAIAVVTMVFVAFALVSSLWIPRHRPDFPGRRGLPAFTVVTLLLFVAMVATMVFVAKEDEEEGDHEEEAALVQHPS